MSLLGDNSIVIVCNSGWELAVSWCWGFLLLSGDWSWLVGILGDHWLGGFVSVFMEGVAKATNLVLVSAGGNKRGLQLVETNGGVSDWHGWLWILRLNLGTSIAKDLSPCCRVFCRVEVSCTLFDSIGDFNAWCEAIVRNSNLTPVWGLYARWTQVN